MARGVLRVSEIVIASFAVVAIGIGLSGCGVSAEPASNISLPPVGGTPDYQLGGAYSPDASVDIVARDREAEPDPSRYSICYVNGFQTQPGEADNWPADTLLHDAGGVVIDPDWPDEVLLDTSSRESRERILTTVAPWIVACAEAGFEAVEFDNLDTYTRSDGALSRDDNLALATAYVDTAHDAGLAAAQKNAAEDAAVLHDRAGFDFAVTEECAAFRECDSYTGVYGDHVIDIEYSDALPRSFGVVCGDPETPSSVVLRDRNLTLPAETEYVFETCAHPNRTPNA